MVTLGSLIGTLGTTFLDSPSSTSTLTYDVRIGHSGSTTQTVYVNRPSDDTDSARYSRGVSTITLIEVAG
jgi:hypothetical protein